MSTEIGRAAHGGAVLRRPKRLALTLQPLLGTRAPLDTGARLRSPATRVGIAHSGRILTHRKILYLLQRIEPSAYHNSLVERWHGGIECHLPGSSRGTSVASNWVPRPSTRLSGWTIIGLLGRSKHCG